MTAAMEENSELRVVALQGAAVEVLCALELQHLLVGRSHECTYPPEIQSLPCLSCLFPEDQALSGSAFKEQRFIRKALAPFQINLKLLRELKPDVIITQDRCEACGGRLDELQKACGRLIFGDDKRCRLLSLKPLMIDDIFQNIQSIAKVCYSSAKGKKLVSNLKTRWKHARQRTPQWADGVPRINVACLQWLEPLIGAGYWIPEIVACAGGFNMFGDVGHHSPVISWPEFMHTDPDVIIIVCLGLNIERASSALASLQNANQWMQLRAVIAKRVYIVNGERYFNLPGTTVVDSAELLVEILYGAHDEQAFLYQGAGFVRWELRNNVEHAVHSNGLQVLEHRSNQGIVAAEDVEGEHARRRGTSEDCLMEKEVQSGQVTFVSHLHSDSDSIVSSENKASVLASSGKGNGWDHCCEEGHVGYKKSASMFSMNSSKRNNFLVDNHSKTARFLDFTSSSTLDSQADISLADPNPSAMKVIGEVSGQQYSGRSMHSSLTDQASPSLHEGRFADAVDQSSGAKLVPNVRQYAVPPTLEMDSSACRTKDAAMRTASATPKRSFETSPIKGSPFSAGRSSNTRSSLASMSSSGTLSEKEVLSRMWASTQAAAKCQSPDAVGGSLNRGDFLHGCAKDAHDCVDITMGHPVYKRVVSTNAQSNKTFEEVKGSIATFGRKRCRTKDTQVDPSLNKKLMGAVQYGTNVVSKSSDCTLSLCNSKLSVFSQKSLALRNLIFQAVKELPFADCLLLSGGLGSTILAEAAQLTFPKSYRIGVTVLAGPNAKDKHFSQLASKEYEMKHIVVGGGDKGNAVDLLELQLDFVVATLRTFNPSEIQKSIALAAGLREAKRLGFSSVVIGDGADELFTGHYCMQSMTEDEFDCYRYQQISSMTYSSVSLGTAVGIKVLQPYLNQKVVEFAAGLSKVDLIGPKDGKVHDRFFLRHAFSEVVSARRSKDSIEVGSGTYVLSEYFSGQVSSAKFKLEASRIFQEDRVQIRDPEHLTYYLAFQRIFKDHAPPGMVRWGSDPCVACGYQMTTMKQMYCSVCGHYPAGFKTSCNKLENSWSLKDLHNNLNESNSKVDDQTLRQTFISKQCPVKCFEKTPAKEFCNTVCNNTKSIDKLASESANLQTDLGALNDDYAGDFVACKSPVAGLQEVDHFEHPNPESEVRKKKRWFWKLTAGITMLVIVLRFHEKRSG